MPVNRGIFFNPPTIHPRVYGDLPARASTGCSYHVVSSIVSPNNGADHSIHTITKTTETRARLVRFRRRGKAALRSLSALAASGAEALAVSSIAPHEDRRQGDIIKETIEEESEA